MPHIHDLIDLTVSAVIIHDGKVLMVHHKKYDQWLFIGGHVELHENPEEAILREAKEESGLEIELVGKRPDVSDSELQSLIAPTFLNIHWVDQSHHHRHIDMMYVARAKTDTVQLAAQEHRDIRWFSPEDLEDPKYGVRSDLNYYTKEALRMVGA